VNETQKAELRVRRVPDAIFHGAHPPKITKGEAAKVVVVQRGASPPESVGERVL